MFDRFDNNPPGMLNQPNPLPNNPHDMANQQPNNKQKNKKNKNKNVKDKSFDNMPRSKQPFMMGKLFDNPNHNSLLENSFEQQPKHLN